MKKPRKESDFRRWANATGIDPKILREWLGMSENLFSATMQGRRVPSPAEQLAMSAITVGLSPWSPDSMAELQGYATAVSRLRLAAMEPPPTAS